MANIAAKVDRVLETLGEMYRGAKLASPFALMAGLATELVKRLGVAEAAEQYGPAIGAFAVGALARRVHAMIFGSEKAPGKVFRSSVAAGTGALAVLATRSMDQGVIAAGAAVAGTSAQGAAERSADKTQGVPAALAESHYR